MIASITTTSDIGFCLVVVTALIAITVFMAEANYRLTVIQLRRIEAKLDALVKEVLVKEKKNKP